MRLEPWHNRLFSIGLGVLLLLSLTIRINAIFNGKQGLSHDESISYLCSANTQVRYSEEFKAGTDLELTAGQIQSLYAAPERLAFGEIALGMARLDIHPPLYWWVLHVIHHFLGFHLNEGMVLNFFVGLLTLLLLFHIVRSTTSNSLLALLVATLYWIGPAVLQLDLEARHYSFLGFFALAGFWLTERISSGNGGKWMYPTVVAVHAGGLLTHYYYPFIMLPSLALVWWRCGRGKVLWQYLGLMALSVIAFLAMFPQFLVFIGTYINRTAPQSQTTLQKIWAIAYFGFENFFADGPKLLHALAVMVLLSTLIALGVKHGIRQKVLASLRRKGPSAFYLLTLLYLLCFTILFYLFRLPPPLPSASSTSPISGPCSAGSPCWRCGPHGLSAPCPGLSASCFL